MQVMCKDNTNTVLSEYRIYDVYRVLRKYFVVVMQDKSVQAVPKNQCSVINIKKWKGRVIKCIVA